MKTYIIGDNISHYDIGEPCQFTFSGVEYWLHPELVSKYEGDVGNALSQTTDMADGNYVGLIVDKEVSGNNYRLVVMAKYRSKPTIIKYYVTGYANSNAGGGTAELTRGDKPTGGTAELTRGGKHTGGTAELTHG